MVNTTWSTTDKNANVTLSGSNLTATVSGAGGAKNGSVRTADRQITGKYYWETTVTIAASSTLQVGVANSSAALTVSTNGSVGQFVLDQNGRVGSEGTQLTTPNFGTITTGSVICIALDTSNHLIWFRIGAGGNWNNNSAFDPATGNGGVSIPDVWAWYPYTGMSTANLATQNVVANFGDTAFTGTVPSGFTSGFPTGSPTLVGAVTSAAIEEWADGNPSGQVTSIAIEEWAAPTGTLYGLVSVIALEQWAPNNSGDFDATLDEVTTSSSDTYTVGGFIASLAEATTSSSDDLSSTSDAPVTLTDSGASSDTLDTSVTMDASLDDTVVSDDAPLILTPMFDFVASSDIFFIGFQATLDDTVVSDDVWDIPVPLQETASSSDEFTVDSDFFRTLEDIARSYDYYYGVLNPAELLQCGPIPIFPDLPDSYPNKISPVMDTTIGTVKSLREVRVPQQPYALWDIEMSFEELRDETQNTQPYLPFFDYHQYRDLVQTFLMMYGQTGVFALDCPWDNSRTDQIIGVGDGTTMDFTVFRTWATGSFATLAPVGMINTVFNVKINGTPVSSGDYTTTRNEIHFNFAPASGATITMTFSFYYVCRFVEDEQNFEEFSKNRWTVTTMKVRAVYWPGCQ